LRGQHLNLPQLRDNIYAAEPSCFRVCLIQSEGSQYVSDQNDGFENRTCDTHQTCPRENAVLTILHYGSGADYALHFCVFLEPIAVTPCPLLPPLIHSAALLYKPGRMSLQPQG
jgi:hypothetical protein